MFTVVIPLYNKALYIQRAIDSVLSQDFQEFECIVVDDGSTDNSAEIVRSYTDDRIKLICQQNSGVSAARNRGIREAKYKWIAFLDADDEWLPFHLTDILDLTDRGFYMIMTNCLQLPSENLQCGRELPSEIDYYMNSLQSCSTVGNSSSTAVLTDAFNLVGAFDEKQKYSEDRDMWNRAASLGPVGYISRVSAICYDVSGSATKNVIIPFNIVCDFIKSFDRMRLLHCVDKSIQKNHEKYIGFITAERLFKSIRTNKKALPMGLFFYLTKRYFSSYNMMYGLLYFMRKQMPVICPRLCRLIIIIRNNLRELLKVNRTK